MSRMLQQDIYSLHTLGYPIKQVELLDLDLLATL